MGVIEARLAERGLILPPAFEAPPGARYPFPDVNIRGRVAYVSGHGPQEPDGSIVGPFGKVGDVVSPAEAARLARKTGLSMLGSLSRALGDLDRIEGWARVLGMVNAAPGFDDHPAVINGFSELVLDLFGHEIGRHARSAVGVASLPLDYAVEIEAEVLIRV